MHVGPAYGSIESRSSHGFAVRVRRVCCAAPQYTTWVEFEGCANCKRLVEVKLTLEKIVDLDTVSVSDTLDINS